ncbi:hypothetical protein [Paenibacillus roseipurpureus]|uniref:YtkA-like domain-containing protein n=1 Tax=Paenibacillus roseopurpureus TaxID=2918901 RepID=A0AA96LJK7_9BACL|nr:hypothetical protein [Paenibacillus sp. MBLB1832]WNR42173.1 hypothetical protein MJB10_13600 [Paenibacillus sp. MBLB1832]
MSKIKGLCMIAALALMISGCGTAKKTETMTASYTPTLEVTNVVKDDQVTVHIKTDLKVSKEHYDQQRIQGEGHIHMSLDKGEKIVVLSTEKVFEHMTKGTHELKVSLHNNDHTPYDVSQTISFDVK